MSHDVTSHWRAMNLQMELTCTVHNVLKYLAHSFMLTCTSTMMSRSSARNSYAAKRPLMTITYCRSQSSFSSCAFVGPLACQTSLLPLFSSEQLFSCLQSRAACASSSLLFDILLSNVWPCHICCTIPSPCCCSQERSISAFSLMIKELQSDKMQMKAKEMEAKEMNKTK